MKWCATDGGDRVARIRGNRLTDEGAIAILDAVRWTALLWKLQCVARFAERRPTCALDQDSSTGVLSDVRVCS